MTRLWIIAISILLVPSCSREEPARETAASEPVSRAEEWPLHGRDSGEQRHSPLDQIHAGSVAELGLAWSFDLDSTRGIEATPIVVGGVMYLSGTWNRVYALDARTGELLWRHDPQVPGAWGRRACCDVVNRGVAVDSGRVYASTIDGRLIALEAAKGAVLWEVQTTPRDLPYTITGAPRVVKGKVVIGNGGAELGVRGYVTAYDAETGEQAWRFWTVPGDPSQPFEHPELEAAAGTWTGEWWKVGGGGTAWDSMAYDPELDLLYVGTGNGAPWSRYSRSPDGGDNLFVCSILALRPDTGELVWHYQTTPGDNWDYTSVQHILLADLEIGGRQRKVLMQAPKNGFFYVLDRATGELLSAEPFAPVTWASHVDPTTGRPVEIPSGDYSTEPKLVSPAPLGAHNWHPMSFHPGTGLVYIPAHHNEGWYRNDPESLDDPTIWKLGMNMDRFAQLNIDTAPTLTAHLKAWDPVAQKEVWRVDHVGFFNAGVLSTAGGLVFQGAGDGIFSAYDARDGTQLWSVDTTTGIIAAPISYSLDGVQYVAIAAGWGGGALPTGPPEEGAILHHINEGRVLAFRLGGRADLPRSAPRDKRVPKPPPLVASAEDVARGKHLYNMNCLVCHGTDLVSSLIVPDLRVMPREKHAAFDAIVRGGALETQGMPRFGAELSAADANAIRSYVIERAHALYAEEGTLRGE